MHDLHAIVIERMARRAEAAGNEPAADNYRAALAALARVRRGPWQPYRAALVDLARETAMMPCQKSSQLSVDRLGGSKRRA
jgi:hypothetical protein